MTLNLKNSPFTLTQSVKEPDVFVVSTSGHAKRGKTSFALSAPAPMAVISLDSGTKEIVDIERRKGRTIVSKYLGVRTGLAKGEYGKLWDQFNEAWDWALGNKDIRTVVVDTATAMYDLSRLARFGKLTQVMPHHYTELNRELDELVLSSYNRRVNVFFLHNLKKEYVAKKIKGEEKDVWCGDWEVAGFGSMGKHVDLILEHTFLEEEKEFQVQVKGVPRLPGGIATQFAGMTLAGDAATFPILAQMLKPDSDPADWEDR